MKTGKSGTLQKSQKSKVTTSVDDFKLFTNVKIVEPIWTCGEFYQNFKDEKGLESKLVLT